MLRRLIPFAFGLFSNRELLWQFTLRNVELRHKGSHLGLVWSFLSPLLLLALYVFVFGYIYGGSFNAATEENRMLYVLGIFLGLSFFHFMAEIIALSPGIIVANANFVKKVVFPLDILPTAAVGSAGIHLMISLGLVLIGVMIAGPGWSFGLLWLPVIILPVVMLCLGLAWLLSALGVFMRDIGQFVQVATVGLMFASAVFYPASKIPPAAWQVLRFNPLLLAIESARDAVLWQTTVNLNHLLYLYGVGFLACVFGHWCFRRMARGFADVI